MKMRSVFFFILHRMEKGKQQSLCWKAKKQRICCFFDRITEYITVLVLRFINTNEWLNPLWIYQNRHSECVCVRLIVKRERNYDHKLHEHFSKSNRFVYHFRWNVYWVRFLRWLSICTYDKMLIPTITWAVIFFFSIWILQNCLHTDFELCLFHHSVYQNIDNHMNYLISICLDYCTMFEVIYLIVIFSKHVHCTVTVLEKPRFLMISKNINVTQKQIDKLHAREKMKLHKALLITLSHIAKKN